MIGIERLVAIAASGYDSAEPDCRAEALEALTALESEAGPAPTWAPALVHAHALLAPFRDRDAMLGAVMCAYTDGETGLAGRLGTVLRLLDDSVNAVGMLGLALREDSNRAAQDPGTLVSAAWAHVDTGQWDTAADLATRVVDGGGSHCPDSLKAAGHAVLATIAAHRGQSEAVHEHANAAERLLRNVPSWGIRVRTDRARALTALGTGDYEAAYSWLRGVLCGSDGDVMHFHLSPYAVADFAQSAVEIGAATEARAIVEQALGALDGAPSPRLARIAAHASALLCLDDVDASAYFTAAVAPGGETWPFEIGRARLSYGRWLLRHAQAEAGAKQLASAQVHFERLGAEPWLALVRYQVSTSTTPRTAANSGQRAARVRAWAGMPSVQREMLRLAAAGLSDREIRDQMGFSLDTVRAYIAYALPAFGISDRTHLRAVVKEIDSAGAEAN